MGAVGDPFNREYVHSIWDLFRFQEVFRYTI